MHSLRLATTPRVVFLALGLSLGSLALACQPSPAADPTPVGDPFTVVRATSQAAYQAGKTALDQADLMRGCPSIDTARTNDPDNNPAIQQLLDQCLTQIPQLLATSAAAPSPTILARNVVTPNPASVRLDTVPAATPDVVTVRPTPANQSNAARSTPSTVPQQIPRPLTPTSAPVISLVTYGDAQGRFKIGAPDDWTQTPSPRPAFGIGNAALEFRDPSNHANLNVTVDTTAKAISPELYSASLEIGMQQQVPGYASEQVVPVVAGGGPAIRRVFTFTQTDQAGHDLQARAVQIVVIKGQTPYVITGAVGPAEQFQQFGALFDRMVESFLFS